MQVAVLKGQVAELTEKCSVMERALSQQSLLKAAEPRDEAAVPGEAGCSAGGRLGQPRSKSLESEPRQMKAQDEREQVRLPLG